jgi:photosystem I subunit 3
LILKVTCEERLTLNCKIFFFFDTYKRQGLLCGAEGLPHLIVDGRPDHTTVLSGVIFLYIAGYIGWAGRSYLQYSTKLEGGKKWDREIIINVPIALGYMSGSFIWPLVAWKELIVGDLIVPDDQTSVSIR